MTIKSNSQAGRGTVSGATAAGLMIAGLAMGCARSTIMEGEDVTCGEGTVLQDDECVVDGSTGGGSSGPGGAVSCTEARPFESVQARSRSSRPSCGSADSDSNANRTGYAPAG